MLSKYVYGLSLGHFVVDFSQGALAALLPLLIAQHHFNYAIAATLVFAMNLVSSIIQPLFGFSSDRFHTGWIIIPALLITGLGFGTLGWDNQYFLLITSCLVCGVGIAAYHPDAAKLVNGLADVNQGHAMSVFSFGGNLGFACGPITVTLVANALGISGVGLFILVGGGVALLLAHYFPAMRRQSAQHWQQKRQRESDSPVPVKDDWRHFAILACVLFGRSIIFYGLNTFLVLYWMHILKQSNTSGSLALSILFIVGATGTIIGGHLVDHIGAVKTIRLAFTIMLFLLLAFSLTKSVIVASVLLLPIGMLIFTPYSAIVLLGQRYLPNQMGLASGVTLGLAISIGGIATPFLGQVADATSLIIVFFILTAVALIPMGAVYFIIEPTIK